MSKAEKLPKFLFCQNVLASDRDYIIHTREPMFIAEIAVFNDEQMFFQFQKSIEIGARTEFNDRMYVVFPVKIISDIEYKSAQEKADKWAKLMSRTGDWLFNYLKNL